MRRTAVAQGSRVDAVLTAALALVAVVALALPPQHREPIAAAVRRSVGVPLLTLQERAERTRGAFLAHDSTRRVVDSLALESADVRALRAENESLRNLLGLAARLRWGFIASEASFVSAEALGDRGIGREVMLTLNVGSRSGITPYAPVLSPAGLVGRVRAVDPTTSTIELFSHENFRVSAMTADQRVVGIVSAHRGQLGDELTDEYLLEMGGVQFRDTLEAGTVIYTSGLGGTVPAYIPVGTVVRELSTAELWARTYILRPMVRPSEIRSVLVLLPARAAAGVEGIWVSAPDSAAAVAAAAGDSLIRQAAAADSAARVQAIQQRVLDSLRAVGVQLSPLDSAAAAAAAAAAADAVPPPSVPGPTPVRRPPALAAPAATPDSAAPPDTSAMRPASRR